MEMTTAAQNTPNQNPNEKFFHYFQNEVNALQEQIDSIESRNTAGGELNDAVDHCRSGIARLSDEVKGASSFLPSYDQRTYSEAIKALSSKLQIVRSQVAPRQKFSFKSTKFKVQKNASAILTNNAAELAEQRHSTIPGFNETSDGSSLATAPSETNLHPPGQSNDAQSSDRSSSMNSSSIAIFDKQNEYVTLPGYSTSAASSATLTNIKRCVIDLVRSGTKTERLATLTFKDISRSLIICPDLAGPVHLTNVSRSVLAIGCRQFRMHDSVKSHVYLHCTSRPIVEDCSEICFAPLPETIIASQIVSENMWDRIDDFKWLRAEQSPNWAILAREQRVMDQIWANVRERGQDTDVQRLLADTGLPE